MKDIITSVFTVAAIIIWGRVIIDYAADAFAAAMARNSKRY